MSEKRLKEQVRKAAGIAMIPAAAALLITGLLPLQHTAEASYKGRNEGLSLSASVLRLSAHDTFNIGGAEELALLPGIGKSIAALVLAERAENGIFYYPEDIMAVKGIGEKKLELIRPGMLTEDEGRGE